MKGNKIYIYVKKKNFLTFQYHKKEKEEKNNKKKYKTSWKGFIFLFF